MQIVIDIPDNDYKSIVNPYQFNEHLCSRLKEIVRQGTPLPKGHGRLIDADNITFSQFFDAGDYAQAMRGIYDAPTIIEAESEE